MITYNNSIDLNALNKIQYGVFIVSSFFEDRLNAQIATVVFQVTCAPVQIVTCICKENLTHQFISSSKSFGVSILSQNADLKFIGRFGFRSGRDLDKFAGINYQQITTGSPLVLDNSVGILDLKVVSQVDVGTHTLFVGELVAASVLNDTQPLSYDYYHRVIKGKTHQNAPTFMMK